MKNGRSTQDATGDSSNTPAASEPVYAVRTTGRVKKPKTVFDPSDIPPPRALSRVTAAPAATAGSSNAAEQGIGETKSNAKVGVAASVSQQNEVKDFGKGWDTCVKCSKSEPRRGSGFKSNYIGCRHCNRKWHYQCLVIEFDEPRLVRKRYKCEECRICCLCHNYNQAQCSGKNNSLIMCSHCGDSFHLDCHFPAILRSRLNERHWKCSKCDTSVASNSSTPTKQSQKDSADGGGDLTPKTESTQQGSETDATPKRSSSEKTASVTNNENDEDKEKNDGTDNDDDDDDDDDDNDNESDSECECDESTGNRKLTIDNVSEWSTDDVVRFFENFYPSEANVFRDQDIDGASLLLLKRGDIIKRFNLKLGPSLRLYELVIALQTKEDNIINAWNDDKVD